MRIPFFSLLAGGSLLLQNVICDPNANPWETRMFFNAFQLFRLLGGNDDQTMAPNIKADGYTFQDFIKGTHDNKNWGPKSPKYSSEHVKGTPLFPAGDWSERSDYDTLKRSLLQYSYDPKKLFPNSVRDGGYPAHADMIRLVLDEVRTRFADVPDDKRAAANNHLRNIQYYGAQAMSTRMHATMRNTVRNAMTNYIRSLPNVPNNFSIVEKRDILFEYGNTRVFGVAVDLDQTIAKYRATVQQQANNNPSFITDFYDKMMRDSGAQQEVRNHRGAIDAYGRGLTDLPHSSCRVT